MGSVARCAAAQARGACRPARRKCWCSSSTTISARRAVWRGCSTRTSSRSTRRRIPASSCSRTATYPLETECGAFGNAGHAAACEAAAAVRMAREKNRDRELEAALFERQSPSMTRDEVVTALQQVAQISSADFDAKYAKTLESIRADVQLGQKLGVQGTPTFLPEWHPAAEPPAGLLRCRARLGDSPVWHGFLRGLWTGERTIREDMMGWMPSRPKVSRSTTR